MNEPTIVIPDLVDPQVPGSGEYTAREAMAYLDARAAHIAEQRVILRRLIAVYEEAVRSDASKPDDEAPEVTAKINEATELSYGRLVREFETAFKRVPPPPHVARDTSLLDLLENFASYDIDRSGGLSLKESRLPVEIYRKLAPEGELTPERIKLGISPASRPSKGTK
jgi:hypothetical protein